MFFPASILIAACSIIAHVAAAATCGPDTILLCGSFGGSLVVPQVIPSFLPSGVLHLVYGNVDVGGAQQLAPERVASTPVISFVASPGTSTGPTYLLVMIDSDAPSPSILQWMQTDLTLQASTNLLISKSAPAAEYSGPRPAQGTGTHRYVALLYEQPAGFSLPAAYANMPTSPLAGSARMQFNLASFLGAAGLGEPVGGNFYKSTYNGLTPANTVVEIAPAAVVVTSAATPSAMTTAGSTLSLGALSVTGVPSAGSTNALSIASLPSTTSPSFPSKGLRLDVYSDIQWLGLALSFGGMAAVLEMYLA